MSSQCRRATIVILALLLSACFVNGVRARSAPFVGRWGGEEGHCAIRREHDDAVERQVRAGRAACRHV